MINYNADNMLRIAKRINNTKRSYLLVNPLQAKHMPVSPSLSLSMMNTLGKKLLEKYPKTKLIVGFAETATAIGAAVAECFADDCVYIHTTREDICIVDSWLHFLEEHSHATEQKLCSENISEWLDLSPSIIFVEDELTTGKTLINIIDQMQEKFPIIEGLELIAASLINRLTPENEQKLRDAGVKSEYLLKISDNNYSEVLSNIELDTAHDFTGETSLATVCKEYDLSTCLIDPRIGVEVGKYKVSCKRVAEEIIDNLKNTFLQNDNVLILGTEECMYPALILGKEMELLNLVNSVVCHSTTRSPIGISSSDDSYPITSGYKLSSFYDSMRETYIYNLSYYSCLFHY